MVPIVSILMLLTNAQLVAFFGILIDTYFTPHDFFISNDMLSAIELELISNNNSLWTNTAYA